jgi:hypothetical protein
MVVVAGILMLALLVAIVSSVSADYPVWESALANSERAPAPPSRMPSS